MRIVHIHKYFHARDGASRYERGLMRMQEEAGHAVAPFAMHDERNDPTPWQDYFVSNMETKRVAWGFGAVRQFRRALWSQEAYKNFGALLDVFKPDVIHAHNLYTQLSPSPLAAAKERGIPVVMTVHDYSLVSANYALWDEKKKQSIDGAGICDTVRSRWIKHSYIATAAQEMISEFHRFTKAYDMTVCRFITLSSFVRDVMIAKGFSNDQIEVVPAFAEPLIDPRRTIFHDQKESFVLFAGRLESYKGVHVLLEAAKHLPKGTEIWIAGTGPDEERLKAMIPRGASIRFLGFVPGNELWRLMRRARVVVVPSLWHEPFGLVALEAMSQGTPVIVSKRGGLPEVVGEAGVVVPPGDAKALARAIQRVLDDDDRAKQLGEAARARAQMIGNPAEHLERILAIYRSCNRGG